MNSTSIEWTDFSVNPIRARNKETGAVGHHCEKVSDGCKHCYSSRLQVRFRMPEFSGPSRRDEIEQFLDRKVLDSVLRRKKPSKIFWCDMTDMFGEWVPDAWIDDCFAVMAATPQHTHQVLTKRPDRACQYITGAYKPGSVCDAASRAGRSIVRIEIKEHAEGTFTKLVGPDWPLPNVWLGTSVENQMAADERIPFLLKTPAAVRFLSVEPLLGPVEFSNASGRADYLSQLGKKALNGIDWIIVGGESGPGARPCDISWVRSIVDQCRAASVACFVKQLGSNPVWTHFTDAKPSNAITQPYYAASARNRDGIRTKTRLADRKGGDWSEWPEKLRVRQMPNSAAIRVN